MSMKGVGGKVAAVFAVSSFVGAKLSCEADRATSPPLSMESEEGLTIRPTCLGKCL